MDTSFINDIKLVVGLGNIGNEYIWTRHNVGFEFLDTLVNKSTFKPDKDFFSEISEFKNDRLKLFLAKPTTLMNLSGRAVKAITSFYHLEPNQILVIHDDLDIAVGEYKIQFSKGPRVHNGISSVEKFLGTTEFWRIRIGVDGRDEIERKNIEGRDYVLGRFKIKERDLINNVFEDIRFKLFSPLT